MPTNTSTGFTKLVEDSELKMTFSPSASTEETAGVEELDPASSRWLPCSLSVSVCTGNHRRQRPPSAVLLGLIIWLFTSQISWIYATHWLKYPFSKRSFVELKICWVSSPALTFLFSKYVKLIPRFFFFFWENTRLAELSMKETRLAFNNLPAEEEKCYLGCRLRCGRSSPRD